MNEKQHDNYLWDREGEPDDDVRRLEVLMAPLAHDPRRPHARNRSRYRGR